MGSSTDRDRGTKTLPLRIHGVPQQETVNEIIDGELIDEDGHGEPRQTSRRGEKGRRLSDDWETRRQREVPFLAVQNQDPMTHLQGQVQDAGRKYMEHLRKSDILSRKMTPKQRSSQLTGIHKGYVSMMVLSCIQPLSQGINARSVLNMVGMGSAMWMLSPNFRDQVGDYGIQMGEAVRGKIRERKQQGIDKVISKAGQKAEKREAKGKPLSEKWQKRLDNAERANRGGRDAFTAKSAGMAEVALAENAYAAMRVEGADVEAIRAGHDSLRNSLYELAQEDGVEAAEVAEAARVVVGLRLEEEPELASVFGELAHGQFTKSDPREVRIAGTEDTARVWTGEFESRFGQPIVSGSFNLRNPMDADQHQAAIADTMTADMVALTRQRGVDGLNMGVVSYAAAWGLQDSPEYEGMLAMDNPLGERLRTSRLMMDTMDADGISPEEKQRIYSNAYVDAMEMLSTLHPDVEQQWGEKFGADWKENMRDFVSDPTAYMNGRRPEWDWEEPETPSSAREAGPASNSRTYRTARINQNYIETASTGVTGFGSDSSDFRDPGFEMGG